MRRALFISLIAVTSFLPTPATAAGTWVWPVEGPVIRAFDPPDSPFGTGHRGIDIAAPSSSTLVAPESGTVTFAGPVGGRLFVTIDHGGGVVSTLSFLEVVLVRKGDEVAAGETVALSGSGHADAEVDHVHLGVRLDDVYVDPLDYLGPLTVSGFIRLAPWNEGG